MTPSRCPLCGEANACAMTGTSASPCWCTRATFAADLIEALPPAARGTACICARCAAAPVRKPEPGERASARTSSS